MPTGWPWDTDSPTDTDPDTAESVEVSRTKAYTYTEHTADIALADGTVLERSFDGMDRTEAGAKLFNYADFKTVTGYNGTRVVNTKNETFLFVPYDNLLYVETTDREEHTVGVDYIERVPVDQVRDDDVVVDDG